MKRAIILVLLAAASAWGQVSFVKVEPECRIYFSFTAVGTQQFDNRTQGCTSWIVTYSSFTFAGPLSLALQDAPNAAGSVPGAWVNFAGTIVSGINPNTSLVGATTEFRGYYPWIRINLTATGAGAGLVVGTAYGWRTGAPTTISGTVTANQGTANAGGLLSWPVYWGSGIATPDNYVNTVMQPVTIAGGTGPVMTSLFMKNTATNTFDHLRGNATGGAWVQGPGASGAALAGNPVRVAGSDGTNTSSFIQCPLRAVITLNAAGNTQIIAAGANTIRVCQISLSLDTPTTVQLTEGTGANCAVGTANVTGAYQNVQAMVIGVPQNPFALTANQALCVNLGAVVNAGGMVQYAQY